MTPSRLVIATRNPKKLEEIRAILAGSGLEVVGVAELDQDIPDVDEDRPTFQGNAEKKALSVAQAAGTLAIADDSGLVVDALDGAPGVRSARFSGEGANAEKNNALLLEKLQGVPEERRTARFRCVVAIADPEGILTCFEGACEGIITGELRGSDGFGYDPLFLLPDRGLTFAEIGAEEKNRISHRARAFEPVPAYLKELAARREL